ncbi:MAG: hypothetical protein ACI9XJ_002473 [Marivirga sp.]|jgi:hypothetical protein
MRFFFHLINCCIRIVPVFFLLLLISLPTALKAQSISNVRATLSEEKVIVTYDLNANDASISYNVSLYISKDDYSFPLRMVKGDVGPGVKAGDGKRIEWLAKQELGAYSGELVFEVRAIPPLPTYDPLKVLAFQKSIYKAGNQVLIQWEDGDPKEEIQINLLKNDLKVQTIATVKNSASRYKFIVPEGESDINYKIQLKNKHTEVTGSTFTISTKFPMKWVWIGVGAAAAATAVVILTGSDSGSDALPAAPEPN